MADYLHETDTRPTFDIDLDMTITGESTRKSIAQEPDLVFKAAGEDEPTHVMRSNLKHLAYS